MHVVIVCDSKFGNTRRLAETMRDALAPEHAVDVREPADGLPVPGTCDLLLVGGPTHAHGASKPLKDALLRVPGGTLRGTRAATFDTRIHMARLLTGSAAGVAAKRLGQAGAMIVAPPESFFVTRDNPPTIEVGELDRAAAWAREVVATA